MVAKFREKVGQEDTAAKNLSQFVHIGCFIVGAAQVFSL